VLHFFPRHRAMTQTPNGTRVPVPLLPGTAVPGFLMTPLRGWIFRGLYDILPGS